MNIESHKAGVSGMLIVRAVGCAVRDRRPPPRLDVSQNTVDGTLDTVLCKSGIFSAGVLEPLLAP